MPGLLADRTAAFRIFALGSTSFVNIRLDVFVDAATDEGSSYIMFRTVAIANGGLSHRSIRRARQTLLGGGVHERIRGHSANGLYARTRRQSYTLCADFVNIVRGRYLREKSVCNLCSIIIIIIINIQNGPIDAGAPHSSASPPAASPQPPTTPPTPSTYVPPSDPTSSRRYSTDSHSAGSRAGTSRSAPDRSTVSSPPRRNWDPSSLARTPPSSPTRTATACPGPGSAGMRRCARLPGSSRRGSRSRTFALRLGPCPLGRLRRLPRRLSLPFWPSILSWEGSPPARLIMALTMLSSYRAL
ncbi:hypothetical protein KC347_g272 [Hortaea werneckii]|nr:hypothetical protein KC347_g272 [Hortaea werneckii]